MSSPWTSVASGALLAVKSGIRSRSVEGSNTAPDNMCAAVSRAFSSTAMATGSPPFCFWSCASRSAADMPADPPPTINTSTSRVSRDTYETLAGVPGVLEVPERGQVIKVLVLGVLKVLVLGVLTVLVLGVLTVLALGVLTVLVLRV